MEIKSLKRIFQTLIALLIIRFLEGQLVSYAANNTFSENFYVNWGNNNVRVDGNGETVQLTLDKQSGSGFASLHQYLYGSVSMQIKLVPGNSAGTVTAFYMTSQTGDELDFEFLGELSSQRYTLQTNVFAAGHGNREQRIHLWFDPAADFHTYSILWNKQLILFKVDDIPIRAFLNNKAYGVAYPNSKPMGIFTTLWNGESWATQGGSVKTDWSKAPFVATFRGFHVEGCTFGSSSACATQSFKEWWNQSQYDTLSSTQLSKLKWVKQDYTTYDYCTYKSRFQQIPSECSHNP